MQYEKDRQSPFKDLFLEATKLVLSFDGIRETKNDRITTYSNDKGGICHIRTMPYGIDLGFLKGVKMEDKYKLLTGNGKAIRVLQQKGELNKEAVTYYINQALDINAKKK